jgi:hypothetical protein
LGRVAALIQLLLLLLLLLEALVELLLLLLLLPLLLLLSPSILPLVACLVLLAGALLRWRHAALLRACCCRLGRHRRLPLLRRIQGLGLHSAVLFAPGVGALALGGLGRSSGVGLARHPARLLGCTCREARPRPADC